MTSFKLAHLSDPHLPPLPKARFSELAGKRALGYLNWTRNRRKYYRREVLDALVSDLLQQAPDHVAVTGDLVNLALESEFAPARQWLGTVGEPHLVTAIPGNHDAYVRATRHRFVEAFGDYASGDQTSIDSAFPFVRRRGPLVLIGLSSAVPTAPFMATGTLGRPQLEALEDVLASLSTEQAFRVLLVHHPLHSDSRPKRLTDSAKLIALLRKHGVELILHGHDHVHSTTWFEGPERKIPSIGVPAASALARARHPAAAYNLYAIEREGDAWRCEQIVRGIGHDMQIEEIGRKRLM